MNRILALDASSTAIGWALFVNGKHYKSGVEKLKGKTVEERIFYMCGVGTSLEWREIFPTHLAIEEPWAITGHSAATASALNRMLGAIVAHYHDTKSMRAVHLVQVSAWRKTCGIRGRGTDVLKRAAIRFASALTSQEITDHNQAEAIGVGHHFVSTYKETEK